MAENVVLVDRSLCRGAAGLSLRDPSLDVRFCGMHGDLARVG
jgi:hypothetical protein